MNTIILNTSDGNYYQFNATNSLELVSTPTELESKNIFLIDNAVNIISVHMPLKQEKQIEKALPFALEESISSDLDDTYIKYIGKVSDKAYALVSSKNLISLFSKDEKTNSVIYMPAILPQTENGITIAIISDTAMIHISKLISFSVPVSLLEQSLASLIHADKSLKTIGICELTPNKNGTIDNLLLAQLENLHLEIVDIEPKTITESLKKVDTKKSTLLSGEFKRAQKKNNVQFNKLNGVFALIATLLAITFLITQIYKTQLDNKVDAIQTASIEFYQKLFPNEIIRKRLMRKQFDQYIRNASGSEHGEGAFTGLLSATALEAKTFKNMQFESVKYSDKNQYLEVALFCSNINEIDQLKQKLSAKGFVVDIASANQSGNNIKAVIKVKHNG